MIMVVAAAVDVAVVEADDDVDDDIKRTNLCANCNCVGSVVRLNARLCVSLYLFSCLSTFLSLHLTCKLASCT